MFIYQINNFLLNKKSSFFINFFREKNQKMTNNKFIVFKTVCKREFDLLTVTIKLDRLPVQW